MYIYTRPLTEIRGRKSKLQQGKLFGGPFKDIPNQNLEPGGSAGTNMKT